MEAETWFENNSCSYNDVCGIPPHFIEFLGMVQKLPLLTQWINERAEGPGARVSTTTLYEGADRGENASRVGSWIKGRWCLKTVELEEASAAFESARQGIRSAAVVAAEPACYVLCA